jgi:hypothetical protein
MDMSGRWSVRDDAAIYHQGTKTPRTAKEVFQNFQFRRPWCLGALVVKINGG